MAGGKKKIFSTVVSLAGAVDPSLGKAAKAATDALGNINLKAVAVAAAAGGIAVAVGKAVFEAGKYLADLGGQFDGAADAIRIGTGATGDALDALNADFDEVYKSVPTTMEDAALAIADYNTRLGLTGEELQGLSVQAIQVSDMLGDDLGTVIEESSQAFQQWGVDSADMAGKMDYVFKVSQSTGKGFSELMASVQSFGPQLQDMGYSFESAAALIGQLDKAGVNAEEVMGAMKKSVGALAKQGLSASDGLAMYYEAIRSAGSETEAASVAAEIFGARAGSTMAAAIRNGSLAAGDFAEEMLASGESIGGAAADTYDFAENLQLFKQNAEVALRPLANTVFDSLNALMPPVMRLMETLGPAIAEVTDVIAPLVTELFDGLMPAIEGILPIVMGIAKNVVSKLLPPVMRIINAVLPALMTIVEALLPVFDAVIDVLGPILDIVANLIAPIMDLVVMAIDPLIRVVMMLLNSVLRPLLPVIQFVGELITGALGGAISAVMPVIDALIGVFQGVIDFFVNVFTGNWQGAWDAVVSIFSNIWDGIVAIFKIPINWVIDGINLFLGALNKIKIPDWVPVVGGKGINIPLIPRLAEGGFTDGLSIAGEAGVEAVISFDRSVRAENLEHWARAGEMLGVPSSNELPSAAAGRFIADAERSSGGGASLDVGGGTEIVIEAGAFSFAPQITLSGRADKEDVIRALQEEEPRFFDLLEDFLDRRAEGAYAGGW
jgi:TP901 family phage tail tape measure protein